MLNDMIEFTYALLTPEEYRRHLRANNILEWIHDGNDYVYWLYDDEKHTTEQAVNEILTSKGYIKDEENSLWVHEYFNRVEVVDVSSFEVGETELEDYEEWIVSFDEFCEMV